MLQKQKTLALRPYTHSAQALICTPATPGFGFLRVTVALEKTLESGLG